MHGLNLTTLYSSTLSLSAASRQNVTESRSSSGILQNEKQSDYRDDPPPSVRFLDRTFTEYRQGAKSSLPKELRVVDYWNKLSTSTVISPSVFIFLCNFSAIMFPLSTNSLSLCLYLVFAGSRGPYYHSLRYNIPVRGNSVNLCTLFGNQTAEPLQYGLSKSIIRSSYFS